MPFTRDFCSAGLEGKYRTRAQERARGIPSMHHAEDPKLRAEIIDYLIGLSAQ